MRNTAVGRTGSKLEAPPPVTDFIEATRATRVRVVAECGRRCRGRAIGFRRRVCAVAALAVATCLATAPAFAQGAVSKEQMQSLDEQVQEIKSDVLGIAAELSHLEEKLLYPSNTQVAVFVSLAEGETLPARLRPDLDRRRARRAPHLQLQGAGGPPEGRRTAHLHRQRPHGRAPARRLDGGEAGGRREISSETQTLLLQQGGRAEARGRHPGRPVVAATPAIELGGW